MNGRPSTAPLPRLIATDLDGTLLSGDHETISSRTRAALVAAADRGIRLVAVSGRQAFSIAGLVEGTPLHGFAIGSNGSVGMNLTTGRVEFEHTLSVEAQTTLARALKEQFPGLLVTTVHSGGNAYLAEHGYPGDQGVSNARVPWPVSHRFTHVDEVLATPSVKLVLLDPGTPAEHLLAAARELAIPGCQPTASGAPFLEVAAEGVTKGSALETLCDGLGIDAADVVAFGDNINDVEMLAWAGRGVAMGNATVQAREVANAVTSSNVEEGVAVAIEGILAEAQV